MFANAEAWIGEEHRPKATDRNVEAGRAEAMHLGVGQLVPNVVECSAAVT